MYVSICLNLNRTKITIYIYGSSYTYIVLYIFKKNHIFTYKTSNQGIAKMRIDTMNVKDNLGFTPHISRDAASIISQARRWHRHPENRS